MANVLTPTFRETTNEQILKKAIEKAVKNGYKVKYPIAYWFKDTFEYIGTLSYKDYFIMIFSHDFAKAFWKTPCGGNKKVWISNDKKVILWQYHLQQMVLKEEPLKYLEKFL